MSAIQAKTDRILDKEGKIYKFLTGDSDNRNYLIELLKKSLSNGEKSIALCFRGDYAALYYRSHKLLSIRSLSTGIIGEFDFRHARFTKEYKVYRNELEKLGVDFKFFSDEDGKSNKRYVRFYLQTSKENVKTVEKENLEKILESYKKLIDDFVDPNKREYFFDRKDTCRKSHNTEKDRQQALYAHYFLNEEKGLTYFDTEYAEHYAKEKEVAGRFDLLGLRRKEDGSYTLLLTEVKSKKGACKGPSGIEKHEKDYLNYWENKELIKYRKKEAKAAIELLSEIFGMPFTVGEITDEKIQFVFTDEAIAEGKKYKQSCEERNLLDKIEI